MRFANENGFCELNPFPGCSQIVVSNHAFIYPEKRGHGEGRKNHQLRVQRATDLGHDVIICTVRAKNLVELAILRTEGWEKLLDFKNTETGNMVELWAKKLSGLRSPTP